MVLQISAVLEPVGPATALELTDAQVVELGGGKRAPVRVTIGERPVRLRLAGMGGKNLIGLSQAARKELGVAIGDAVTATVELDDAERVLEVPDDLGAALDADPAVRTASTHSPSPTAGARPRRHRGQTPGYPGPADRRDAGEGPRGPDRPRPAQLRNGPSCSLIAARRASSRPYSSP